MTKQSELFRFVRGWPSAHVIPICRRARILVARHVSGDLTMRMPRRVLMAAAAAIVLMAVPAYAQMGGGRGKQHQQGAQGTADKAQKADEKAYRDALKSIPAAAKPDPWKSMR
jgi:hypothetical protein